MQNAIILVGSIGALGFAMGPANVTKRLREWSTNEEPNKNYTSTSPPPEIHHFNAAQEERIARSFQIVADRSETSLTRKLMSAASAGFLVFFIYSYYVNRNNTKKVIDKVDETSQETQELVKECDDNNQKRIEDLDEREQERANELSIEIRGEQRAHFEVLSKQLNCVTQVCLQTMSAIANGISKSSEDGNEFGEPKEELLAYAEKAQEMSDNLFDRETYLKAVEIHMDECRAQINNNKRGKMKSPLAMRGNGDDMIIAGEMTSGDRDDIEESGNDRNSPYIRKMSAPGLTNSSSGNNKNKGNAKRSIMDLQFVKNMKLGHITEYYTMKYVDPAYIFVNEHKKLIVCGGAMISLLAIGYNQYSKKTNVSSRKNVLLQ